MDWVVCTSRGRTYHPATKLETRSSAGQRIAVVSRKVPDPSKSSSQPDSPKGGGVRRHPVQRAPSRLYRAGAGPGAPPDKAPHTKYRCPNTCIGPEFVVRATQPSKVICLKDTKPMHTRKVIVILLNGQKLEISCDPTTVTAGQIYEVTIKSEGLADNYTLGLAALLGGDFVFLEPSTRLCKVGPVGWSGDPKKLAVLVPNLTLYVRVKFLLNSLRGTRSWSTKHLLYLQLRRSLLEQQISCTLQQQTALAGLALQAEFGDYSDKEHGCGAYFLLEHYVPESLLQKQDEGSLRTQLQGLHKERKGLDPGRAEETYITKVQDLQDYGWHFHRALWVCKPGTVEVWVAVSLQGISFYRRTDSWTNRPLLQLFLWLQVRTLSYSRQCLHLESHSEGSNKPVKYKLRMNHNKSFFLFHLASAHHKLFLKLRSGLCSFKSLSTEFGLSVREEEKENDLSFCNERSSSLQRRKEDAAGLIKPNLKEKQEYNILPNSLHVPNIEEYQNKENESPSGVSKRQGGVMVFPRWDAPYGTLPLDKDKIVPSLSMRIPVCETQSLPRRQRVRMGTRTFLCHAPKELFANGPPSQEQLFVPGCESGVGSQVELYTPGSSSTAGSQVELLASGYASGAGSQEELSLPDYSSHTPPSEAYVLNSSIKSLDETFHIDFHESLSESLLEKINKCSFEGERIFRTFRLVRDSHGTLGVQISAGTDGGVFIESILPNGPADQMGAIKKGDQVIAVDGHDLLNVRYEDALHLLQTAGDEVEVVLSQVCSSQVSVVEPAPVVISTYPKSTSVGVDLLGEVWQKPIEDSYLRSIRFETALEVCQDKEDMANTPIPQEEKRVKPRRVKYRAPSPPGPKRRALCCEDPGRERFV